MTTYLRDVFSIELLNEMIDGGFVRVQYHPTEPYAILNYTEKATFDKVWNEVTLACRGLIYDTDNQEVIARPFKKFMNHGESTAAVIDLDEPVVVTDKMDGSLGILYRLTNGNPAIATRGSFASEQAIHATARFYELYSNFTWPENTTLLFEIVYPQNRIVLDYGDMDDLVLLGAVRISDGFSVSAALAQEMFRWPGPAAQTFPVPTFAKALAMEPRPNAEGIVVHSIITDERLKIKQADYVALHKIVTNLSERSLWEGVMEGKTREEIIAPLPDEFHQWSKDVLDRLCETVIEQLVDHREAYSAVVHNLDVKWGLGKWGRKEFAQEAVRRNDKWALFMLLDGNDAALEKELWKRAKPEAFLTPAGVTRQTEDAA